MNQHAKTIQIKRKAARRGRLSASTGILQTPQNIAIQPIDYGKKEMNIVLRFRLLMIQSTLLPLARLRLIWFVLIAALRDWPMPDQPESSDS